MSDTNKVLHDTKTKIRQQLKSLNLSLELLSLEQVQKISDVLDSIEVQVSLGETK